MLRDLFSLFPAYAGVIPTQDRQQGLTQAFPRIRGGDPILFSMVIAYLTFSPHTRG